MPGQQFPKSASLAAAASALPTWIPRWTSAKAWAVGDYVRWGNGIYKCVVAVASGVSTPPSAFHDFAVTRMVPVLKYLGGNVASERLYVNGGQYRNDIDGKKGRAMEISIGGTGVNCTITNNGPVAVDWNFYIGPSDTFPGAGSSGTGLAAGSSTTFALTANTRWWLTVRPTTDGQAGFVDVSVADPTKINVTPTWEPVIMGGPEMEAWNSAQQAVASAGTLNPAYDAIASDEAGSISAGIWTCPTGGIWRADVFGLLVALADQKSFDMYLDYVDGGKLRDVPSSRAIGRVWASVAGDVVVNGSPEFHATRGSRWRIKVSHSDAVSRNFHGANAGGAGGPDVFSPRWGMQFVGPLP
jgi:hypothetical protein